MRKKRSISVLAITIYAVYIFLAVLSVLPFWIMFMNATRSTMEIQQHAIAFLPPTHVVKNLGILLGKNFSLTTGLMNSLLISVGATACTVYFFTMTAYGLVAYSWRFRKPFSSFIMATIMIPAQATMTGLYQVVYRVHMISHLAMLALPAIASPSMVFFMRQHMLPTLSMEIIQAAHIDGAGEFYIFNKVVLPIMKSTIVTQVIFSFATNWNNLSMPLVLLMDRSKHTTPIMVSFLRGDICKTEYDSVYPGLVSAALPLTMVYLLLPRCIIAGVAPGGVRGQATVIAGPELGAFRRQAGRGTCQGCAWCTS